MRFCDFLGSLQLKDNLIIYKYISEILTNCFVLIENLNGNLLLDRMPALRQFFGEGIFIDFLEKAISKRIVYMIEGVDNVRSYLFMEHFSSFLNRTQILQIKRVDADFLNLFCLSAQICHICGIRVLLPYAFPSTIANNAILT